MDKNVGPRLKILRERSQLSIRQLAEKADVTPGIISCIERGKNSPSIATLQKVLGALGTDLGAFFSNGSAKQEKPLFLRENMQLVQDENRNYTIVFARDPELAVEVLDEQIRPSDELPEMETLRCDVAGYILMGMLELEVEGKKKALLRPGDAFYVVKETPHRGRAVGDETVRAITVYCPPNY
ncbi:MAG: helix-turn-helix domain-containing protein [Pirellulales bacterium]|nr:helix-turn-helix domain-containing protein [Pirellulales bacterium]